MKKICVVTATRAEYGLLRNTIRRIETDPELELCLVVTGSHLSEDYGYTVREIEQDGFPIEAEIQILESGVGQLPIVKTMANALQQFGETFAQFCPDLLLVLGDRYELLAICEAALMLKIPIAHISGGEITEGVVDDVVRHCITKMRHLHFPGCEVYSQRIIQLGEQPDSVFNYGDVGVENIRKMDFADRKELEDFMAFPLDWPYACVTFHPTTLGAQSSEKQLLELLGAIESFGDMKFIFTGSNADAGGESLNQMIQQFVMEHENCRYYASLGIRRYLRLLKDSEMIIGNSSSGIVEAPCFGIPTVNIGDRQKGRLQADSVINCDPVKNRIIGAVKRARTEEFKHRAKTAVNPYGSGDTSEGIVREIKRFLKSDKNLMKKFYDLPVGKNVKKGVCNARNTEGK